jgi:hypothetical protein
VAVLLTIEAFAPGAGFAPNDTRMLRLGAHGAVAGADTATALQYLYEPIGVNGQ